MADDRAVQIAARKRLVSLSGYMIGLVVIAASVGVYRLDAEALREDAQSLIQLQRFNRFLEANPPDTLRSQLREAARVELAADHQQLNQARLAAREKFTRWLIVGLKGRNPTGCDFFANEVVEGKFASVTRSPTVELTFMEINSAFLDPPSADIALTERGTVKYLLTRLGQLFSGVEVKVVREIDLPPIADPCDPASTAEHRPIASGSQPPPPGTLPRPLEEMAGSRPVSNAETWRPPFKKARPEGDVLMAYFEGVEPAAPYEQRPLVIVRDSVSIGADFDQVSVSSVADLIKFDGSKSLIPDLRAVEEHSDTKDRIERDYGFLPIDYAVSTVGASLVQGYAGTSFMGIKVTPRRLALLVTAASLIVTLMVVFEVATAGRRRIHLRDPAPEGPRAMLLNTFFGRAGLWIVAPAGAVIMAAPPTLPYLAAACIVAVLGGYAVVRSQVSYSA